MFVHYRWFLIIRALCRCRCRRLVHGGGNGTDCGRQRRPTASVDSARAVDNDGDCDDRYDHYRGLWRPYELRPFSSASPSVAVFTFLPFPPSLVPPSTVADIVVRIEIYTVDETRCFSLSILFVFWCSAVSSIAASTVAVFDRASYLPGPPAPS